MFIKRSWNKSSSGKKYVREYLAESYRHPDTGTVRHKHILNLAHVPEHVAEAIRLAVDEDATPVSSDAVSLETGDSLRGAGVLAVYRAYRKHDFDQVLNHLTEAERSSVLAMLVGRILNPSSKLAVKERLADTLLSHLWSDKRLDEDELYRIMDKLHEQFYEIQQRLASREEAPPTLCLYDITSTYFEGTEADDGEYGNSKDKRWDRYQIVIGLVCDEDGVPLALEVWPGNTADSTTVGERVETLVEQFGIEQAVFVGDAGMVSKTNVETITEHGLDYILRSDWRVQRKRLRALTPKQRQLFEHHGVTEWIEDDVRYVGCLSEPRLHRQRQRRRQKVYNVVEQLEHLKRTSSEARRYSWARLHEKTQGIIKDAGVKDLFELQITIADETDDPEQKACLLLEWSIDGDAVRKRKHVEGCYVLETSIDKKKMKAEQVETSYKSLSEVENAFRNIKNELQIRPIFHRLRRRIRAHVLICFLAYYLVKQIELELRERGCSRRAVRCLKRWDQLHLVHQSLQVGDETISSYDWSLGDNGKEIRQHLRDLGIWRSIAAYARGLYSS